LAQDAALIRVIHKRRRSLLRLPLSRWAKTKALAFCWLAVQKSFEWAPREPDTNARIVFRRFRAIYPRFTLVIDVYSHELLIFLLVSHLFVQLRITLILLI
jgi:hypothetical protein